MKLRFLALFFIAQSVSAQFAPAVLPYASRPTLLPLWAANYNMVQSFQPPPMMMPPFNPWTTPFSGGSQFPMFQSPMMAQPMFPMMPYYPPMFPTMYQPFNPQAGMGLGNMGSGNLLAPMISMLPMLMGSSNLAPDNNISFANVGYSNPVPAAYCAECERRRAALTHIQVAPPVSSEIDLPDYHTEARTPLVPQPTTLPPSPAAPPVLPATYPSDKIASDGAQPEEPIYAPPAPTPRPPPPLPMPRPAVVEPPAPVVTPVPHIQAQVQVHIPPPAPAPPLPVPVQRPAVVVQPTPPPAPVAEDDSDIMAYESAAPWHGSKYETIAWTQTALAAIRANWTKLNKAKDVGSFCPGYASASKRSQEICWIRILGGMMQYESSFKPNGPAYHEDDGSLSVGLFQVSPKQCPNAPTIAALQQALPNITCGVNLLANWVASGDSISSRAGGGATWSTLRAPYWAKVRGVPTLLGKQPQITSISMSFSLYH